MDWRNESPTDYIPDKFYHYSKPEHNAKTDPSLWEQPYPHETFITKQRKLENVHFHPKKLRPEVVAIFPNPPNLFSKLPKPTSTKKGLIPFLFSNFGTRNRSNRELGKPITQ